jgi:RNA polymerase sigma-70 factor, ECF subfamily
VPEPITSTTSGNPPGDAEIDAAMDRYARGDDRAFAIVHAGLYQRMRLFLLRLCRVPATADDLLQEVFFRMHRARGSFAAGSRVVPWAYAIARNVHTDHTRSAHTRRVTSIDQDDEGGRQNEIAAGPADDAEQASIARQMAKTVDEVLASLPPAQREAFVLIRYEGMSVADAARILGATENAVKLRAFHAYEALRSALGIEKEKARR